MKAPPRDPLFTAVIAGQMGGLAMLLTAVVLAVAMGKSPAFPLQVMTALIVGPDALHEVALDTLLPGLLAHQLGPSVLWSRAFGLVVAFWRHPLPLVEALLFGAATGVIALLTDVYLLMPRVQRQLHARDLWAEHMTPLGSWAMHLAFGITLGLFYWRWQSGAKATRPAVP